MQDLEYKIKSVVIGHAIGDALGVPVEFASREELDGNPVADMEGFGTYPYPAGSWSDDTSMSLAALDSLAKGIINWDEIMCNFGKWYYKDEYTPTGEMFDVGNTCSTAIENYFIYKKPYHKCGLSDERSNGNGSLMRIHPFTLYEHAKGTFNISNIHTASALTHAHERSKMACGIYSYVLWELLKKPEKSSIGVGVNKARRFYKDSTEFGIFETMLFKRLCGIGRNFSENFEEYRRPKREEIKSGGYVVHTLEAAIFILLHSQSYVDCVLKAVNLGDDTDTVGAVAGGLAGALYGYDAIPQEWIDVLKRKDYIGDMCKRAVEAWGVAKR